MANEIKGLKLEQRHGKSRVRVARVWKSKEDGHHFFVEWNVSISLESNCIPAYVRGDNSDIVATDTMKNTVFLSLPLSIIMPMHIYSIYRLNMNVYWDLWEWEFCILNLEFCKDCLLFENWLQFCFSFKVTLMLSLKFRLIEGKEMTIVFTYVKSSFRVQ